MNKATKITIVRAEGPHALCGVEKTFEGPTCWTDANAWLRSQSSTFPREGGYDKHDFAIVFEDGQEYDGRLDCKHRACADNDLDVALHVANFQLFYAGRRCPAHMTKGQYEGFLARHADDSKAAADFLAQYEVPGAEVAVEVAS